MTLIKTKLKVEVRHEVFHEKIHFINLFETIQSDK